jgi:nucleoside-diphosphate-sugar epimerase
MDLMEHDAFIVGPDDPILVTGATGFIGSRLVETLLEHGFRNVLCFARPSSETARVEAIAERYCVKARIAIFKGNLLSREDCIAATRDAGVIFHLAAGGSEKSFPDAFMNSVVTTRNLLEASLRHKCLKRFVNVSSLAVYSNMQRARGRLLDEANSVETHPELRGDSYCFAKVKQEAILRAYGKTFGIPYVIVRPGYVYGPGRPTIPSRVGIDTFGVFLHLGGSNTLPLTYVDNCAEAILLAGLKKGLDGQAFNVIDDDLPSSRRFLRLYKENVKGFRSVYVPHLISYAFCSVWEWYSNWSAGQLQPVFNRRRWHAYWKKTIYSNRKLKEQAGWTPKVSMTEGFRRCFQRCGVSAPHA